MANNKSATKRIKTSERKKKENAPYKSLIKTTTKKYFKSLEAFQEKPSSESQLEVQSFLNLAYSKIDKAKKKKILHQNTAARKKSRLMKAFQPLLQANPGLLAN